MPLVYRELGCSQGFFEISEARAPKGSSEEKGLWQGSDGSLEGQGSGLAWVQRENGKIMQKEELSRGKANSKSNLCGAVPGRYVPRRDCLPRPEERQLQKSMS